MTILLLQYKQNYFGSCITFFGAFLIHNLNGIILYFSLFLFGHILLLTSSVGSTISYILISAFDQNYKFLKNISIHLNRYRLLTFLRNEYLTLKYFFHFNKMFHKMISIFLVVNIPINACILNWIISGFLPNVELFFIICFMLAQMCAIFLVHFLLTLFSKQIHKPAKILTSMMLKNGLRIDDIRTKIKLECTIQVFHTKFQYGIVYWVSSVITLATFARVCHFLNFIK